MDKAAQKLALCEPEVSLCGRTPVIVPSVFVSSETIIHHYRKPLLINEECERSITIGA